MTTTLQSHRKWLFRTVQSQTLSRNVCVTVIPQEAFTVCTRMSTETAHRFRTPKLKTPVLGRFRASDQPNIEILRDAASALQTRAPCQTVHASTRARNIFHRLRMSESDLLGYSQSDPKGFYFTPMPKNGFWCSLLLQFSTN